MAFPTTGILDDFNRADGGLGANWLANPRFDGSPAFAVSGNQVRVGGASTTYSSSAYSASTFGGDSEVYVSVPTTFANTGYSLLEIGLRFVQTSAAAATADGYTAYYEINAGSATLKISRWDNCVETVILAAASVTPLAAGDKFGFEAIGSTLQAYRYTSGAWATYGASVVDATYSTAGQLLIACYEDARTALLDDFSGGTVVVSSPGARKHRRGRMGIGR